VFSVFGAKGETRLHSCGCDQSIGQLNAVGESVLFDEGGGCGTDGFGKGQDSELELAKRLPDLARLQLRSGTLKKLNEGDNGQDAIRRGVDGAGRPFAAAGRPDQNIGIEDHFNFRKRDCFPMPV
jgi:hypothetical protein